MFDSDDFCLQIASKGVINNGCLSPKDTVNDTVLNTTLVSPVSPSPVYFPISYPQNPLHDSTQDQYTPEQSQPQNMSGDTTGSVLSAADSPISSLHNRALTHSLSFFSMSLSMLAIISLSIKLRKLV